MKPFYGLPILVAMELASGFIFSEVECENRTYQTWWAQVSEWFNQGQWDCRGWRWGKSISQAGFKWIGMSQSARYVPSPVCLEQIHSSAIARQQVQLQKTAPRLTRETQNALISAAISEVSAQITVLQAQQDKLEIDRQDYQQIYTPCPKLFTFDPQHRGISIWVRVTLSLQSILANVEQLGQTYAPTRAAAAIDVWQRQIPHLSGTIHAWWQWVLQALCSQTQDPDTQHWCSQFSCLGSIGINKPKRHGTPNSNRATTKPLNKRTRFLAHSFTHRDISSTTAVD